MLKAQRLSWLPIVRSAALIGALVGFFLFICFFVALQACEEDPRREEHLRETDRLIALGDQQYRVKEYYKLLNEPIPPPPEAEDETTGTQVN